MKLTLQTASRNDAPNLTYAYALWSVKRNAYHALPAARSVVFYGTRDEAARAAGGSEFDVWLVSRLVQFDPVPPSLAGTYLERVNAGRKYDVVLATSDEHKEWKRSVQARRAREIASGR